jgi:hypothetical protein
MFIGGPVALGISFINYRWAKILAIVLAAPILGLGLMLAFSADGSGTVTAIGLGATLTAIGAVINGFLGLKKLNTQPEFAVPGIEED